MGRRRVQNHRRAIVASGAPRLSDGTRVTTNLIKPYAAGRDAAYGKLLDTVGHREIGAETTQAQRRSLPKPSAATHTRLRTGKDASDALPSEATREIKHGRHLWTKELQDWYDAYMARAHNYLRSVQGKAIRDVVTVLWELPAPEGKHGLMPSFDPPAVMQIRAEHMGIVEIKLSAIYGLVRLHNAERDVALLVLDAEQYMVLIDPISALSAENAKGKKGDRVTLYDPQWAEIRPHLPRDWRSVLDTMTIGDPWRTTSGIVPAQYSIVYDMMLTTARLCADSTAIVATAHSQRGKDFTDGTMAIIMQAFEQAEPYYWAPDMCDALVALTPTHPLGKLEKSELPTPCGFAWFGKPLAMPGYHDSVEPLTSMLWYTNKDAARIALTFFTRTPRYPTGEVLATSYINFGRPLIDAIENFSIAHLDPKSMEHITEKHGNSAEAAAWWRDNAEMSVRYFAAAMALMGQRITVASHQLGDRQTTRRYEAEKRIDPELVRVITLRKKEYDARPADGDTVEVAWRCRWIVGYPFGFWRWQNYGDGQRKQILIAPYIKGPQGLPIKGPPKAGTLRAVVE